MRRTKRETQAVIARSEFLNELLAEFGAKLGGFDPGVLAYRLNAERPGYFGASLNFDGAEWAWLEPLLVELRDRRKAMQFR